MSLTYQYIQRIFTSENWHYNKSYPPLWLFIKTFTPCATPRLEKENAPIPPSLGKHMKLINVS